MSQVSAHWLTKHLMIGIALGASTVLPFIVFSWNQDRKYIPRENAVRAVLCIRLDESGRYPSGIANGMNVDREIRNLFGHPAFVDIRPNESPGNEPGVCYYQTSWDRSTYSLFVNGRHGERVKVWKGRSPVLFGPK